ncbi:hypothetical protein [Streptomyces sp. NPDC059781]|uniref:hypothetical protein n=1 Tax=Streptomyces sp. NPDC059781 TaxID=3346943 RepID=UPI00365084D8
MRRTTADRQRRRALVDTSVTAATLVTGPDPVPTHPNTLPRLPDVRGQAVTARQAPEPEVTG